MRMLAALLMSVLLAACTTTAPTRGSEAQIAALGNSIHNLSPQVDVAEARRAARIAYQTSFALAQVYGITDPPLIHNAKVNAGQRPRGLCYHWAEDMEARLNAEGFETIEVARAIANSQSLFLIEHSTAVIIPKGGALKDGIVIDPWRKGGTLYWSAVWRDPRYVWLPREDVLRARGQIRYAHRTEGSLAPAPLCTACRYASTRKAMPAVSMPNGSALFCGFRLITVAVTFWLGFGLGFAPGRALGLGLAFRGFHQTAIAFGIFGTRINLWLGCLNWIMAALLSTALRRATLTAFTLLPLDAFAVAFGLTFPVLALLFLAALIHFTLSF